MYLNVLENVEEFIEEVTVIGLAVHSEDSSFHIDSQLWILCEKTAATIPFHPTATPSIGH